MLEGRYFVYEDKSTPNPSGPITFFDIKIGVPDTFPIDQPLVLETGGRIPRTLDRHIYGEGHCCINVWEEWLVSAADQSFSSYMNGPLRNYFLSQYRFEQTGEWPFGERAHGYDGLIEAYAETLGIEVDAAKVKNCLQLLSRKKIKGHWLCQCGSGKRIRDCHQQIFSELRQKITPEMARRMNSRLIKMEKK